MKANIATFGMLVALGASALGLGTALAGPPPAAPEPPRPAAELDALRKLEGRWTCTGEAPAGPMGPGRRYDSTFRYSRGLGGFFWLSEYDQAAGLAARGFLRWDGGHYTFSAFLSNGATAGETVAFDGRTYIGTGEMHTGGPTMPLRETIKLDGERKMTWTGEVKLGKDFVVIGRDSCHKD
jgi:hypothetical protein